MAIVTDVRTGATGYRDQLARTRRFLARVLDRDRPERHLVDYQDDVWSFFQNCWHLKDWVKHDPLLPGEKKESIKAALEDSRRLAIANDMANGAKHLIVHDLRAGASYSHTRMRSSGSQSTFECVIDVDGVTLVASVVAEGCVSEWERIFIAEGLPIT